MQMLISNCWIVITTKTLTGLNPKQQYYDEQSSSLKSGNNFNYISQSLSVDASQLDNWARALCIWCSVAIYLYLCTCVPVYLYNTPHCNINRPQLQVWVLGLPHSVFNYTFSQTPAIYGSYNRCGLLNAISYSCVTLLAMTLSYP